MKLLCKIALCKKSYVTASGLAKHMKTVHPTQIASTQAVLNAPV